jgi:hypothetical protein
MSGKIKVGSIVALALVLIVLLWLGLYPDKDDPKNIQYVLWKWHLASIDLDRAVGVMHHDRASERMILGRTENSLRGRFGYLRTPEEMPSCYRSASQGVALDGDKVLFLRKSDYLVVFHNGIAERVVLLNDVGPC